MAPKSASDVPAILNELVALGSKYSNAQLVSDARALLAHSRGNTEAFRIRLHSAMNFKNDSSAFNQPLAPDWGSVPRRLQKKQRRFDADQLATDSARYQALLDALGALS